MLGNRITIAKLIFCKLFTISEIKYRRNGKCGNYTECLYTVFRCLSKLSLHCISSQYVYGLFVWKIILFFPGVLFSSVLAKPRRVFELSSVKNFRQRSRLPFLDLCQFENMKKNVAVNINQTPCDLQQSSGFYLLISPEDPKFSANMLRITILFAVST